MFSFVLFLLLSNMSNVWCQTWDLKTSCQWFQILILCCFSHYPIANFVSLISNPKFCIWDHQSLIANIACHASEMKSKISDSMQVNPDLQSCTLVAIVKLTQSPLCNLKLEISNIWFAITLHQFKILVSVLKLLVLDL